MGKLYLLTTGFVCQALAREVVSLVVEIICQKKIGECTLLLAGSLGTGKNALTLKISQKNFAKVLFDTLFLSSSRHYLSLFHLYLSLIKDISYDFIIDVWVFFF